MQKNAKKKYKKFLKKNAKKKMRKGIQQKRSAEDEQLIKLLNKVNDNSDSFVICDCRPRVNAVVNKVLKGKGFEGDSYASSHIMFFDIQNIHQMRSALTSLKKVCENQFDDDWYASLNETKWLQHLTKIIQCSKRVANMVDKDKYSVLVHCSDGWDRTAQVMPHLSLSLFFLFFSLFSSLFFYDKKQKN